MITPREGVAGMTLISIRRLKKVALLLGAGVVFGGLSCVTTAADLAGTGLTVTGVTGVLGDASQGATALGAGLSVFADLVKYTPLGG
jgi:hypothetical protein